MSMYKNAAMVAGLDRQAFLAKHQESVNRLQSEQRTPKKRKPKLPAMVVLLEGLQPKAKWALIFFLLAKASCFSVAPGFIALAHAGKIPASLDWVGLGIYGFFVVLSLFFGAWSLISMERENVPSREEVKKWMKHYSLEES